LSISPTTPNTMPLLSTEAACHYILLYDTQLISFYLLSYSIQDPIVSCFISLLYRESKNQVIVSLKKF